MMKLPALYLPLFLLLIYQGAEAQFIDHFNGSGLIKDSTVTGWDFFTGDGQAKMQFIQKRDHATIKVDAREDQLNIWWALIKHSLTGIDLEKLSDPAFELRAEVRIRVSHAPRRVNLHFNHSRTTDFHSHLMEYDIPDTSNWHVISMTTRDFDARPGDIVNAQMALMDWGREQYEIDIDYFKVDVVPGEMVLQDLGDKIPYHPPLVDPETFSEHLIVAHDATIDSEFPDKNFNKWVARDESGDHFLVSVGGNQWTILRWDVSSYQGSHMKGSGLLELTSYHLERSPDYSRDFGMVRIVEIIAGDPEWEQDLVTYNSFQAGTDALNGQMIIDDQVAESRGQKNYFTISRPVLQRLLDGRTRGLAIMGLGAVKVSFYASENGEPNSSPRLHLNLQD